MKKSFSLIEILVVSTIIAILATGAIVSYSQLSKQSRDSRRKTDIEQIRAALEMFRSNDVNSYYSATSYSNNCVNFAGLTGSPKYIQRMPTDPKTDYYYRCSISTSSYTLGAYLEGVSSGSCGSCGNSNCNYCVGPYGPQ